jgi:hypothetical protein
MFLLDLHKGLCRVSTHERRFPHWPRIDEGLQYLRLSSGDGRFCHLYLAGDSSLDGLGHRL